MKTRATLTAAITLVLLHPHVCAQENGPAPDGAAAQALPADEILGHGYVRRNGAIHFIGGGITGAGANATRIDMPSPALLKKVVDSQYGPFKTAEGLDVESFRVLSEEYTCDDDRAYFKVISPGEFIVIVLPEADPATLEALAPNVARDRKHVWHYDRIQRGLDPASVVLIDGGRVFKDRDSVQYQDETIAGADPASFKHLGSGYYADNNRVYWCTDPIPDADPATFEVLGDSFIGKDTNHAYRSGERLPGIDASSLELILHHPAGFQVYSDKNGIHVNGMAFPRSKPGSVRIIDDHTLLAGDHVLLVETSRSTPVTVFKEDGKLMAEAPAYEPTTRRVEGVITAEVTGQGLQNIRVGPLQGGGEAPSVPDWQMEVFNNPDALKRMLEAGRLIP